jgi:hypothetical protein
MVGAARLICMRARFEAFMARSSAPLPKGPFSPRIVIPDGVSRVPDPMPQSPMRSPLSAFASAGMT